MNFHVQIICFLVVSHFGRGRTVERLQKTSVKDRVGFIKQRDIIRLESSKTGRNRPENVTEPPNVKTVSTTILHRK